MLRRLQELANEVNSYYEEHGPKGVKFLVTLNPQFAEDRMFAVWINHNMVRSELSFEEVRKILLDARDELRG